MVLGTALEAVGVPEAIAIVAVAVLAVWHIRSGVQMLATAGFAVKIIGVVAVVAVAAWAGLIPGISVEVATSRVVGWLAGLIGAAVEAGMGLLSASLAGYPVAGCVRRGSTPRTGRAAWLTLLPQKRDWWIASSSSQSRRARCGLLTSLLISITELSLIHI